MAGMRGEFFPMASRTLRRDSLVGLDLGHYRVIEKIGEGGMGEVYRARDQHLDRDVAIKVLPSATLVDESARKRFHKEALALSSLSHPNIATIHDFDRQQGVDFLVTEYIPGMMLGDKIAGRPMHEKEITHLGTQLAEGLAAAHEQGVVHRDLKPDNLRLTRSGWLKILDFGLAKLVRPVSPEITTESLTETQVVAGTLPYMAPEQLRGEEADARTDIYALGVVLYEMATGQRPFRAKQATRLLDQILHESSQTPRALNPRVSPDLERIIVKCLEKDPENRYQSAREVVVDLRRLSDPDTAYVKELVSRPVRVTVLVAAGILVALSSIAGFWAWRRYLSHGLPQSEKIMLAVLPFENRSGDPSQDFLADGLTEEMIAQLGRVSPRQLGVIAHTSAMRYKNTDKSIAQIGHELRVDYILEGGTRQMGNQVRITAELIHVSDQAQLWSSSYARKVEDILALQNAVALSIAQALAVELLPGVQESFRNVRSVNPQAHEAYLYGRFHWSRLTGQELGKARRYFDQAVRIDPNYPQAYVGLADYYAVTYELPPRVAMAKAREHVQKALALDNALPEAHRALAWIEYADWKWPEAEQHFKLAVKLNPSYAEAHQAYSIFLSTLGRTSEAWEEIHTAQQLDPLSVPINTTAGWIDYFARRYDEAIEQCKKAQDFEPSAANPHDCLGSAYLAKGMFQEAIHQCQMAMTLSGKDPDRAVCLGRAYAAVGDWRQSRKVLQDLQAETGQNHIPPYFVGVLYAALGENDQAFASLEKSYREHDPYLAWIKVSPAVDTLRSDPRLKDLLRRLSFSE
jgi:serine/threonine protein kinase/tetratricopeptide (TPR) repeat protein